MEPFPLPPTPHRAYRRLRPPSGFLGFALLGLLLYIIGTLLLIPVLTHAHFELSRWLLGDLANATISTRLGPWHLDAVGLQVAYLTRNQLLLSSLASLLTLLVAMQFRRAPLWLRHVLGLMSSIALVNSVFLTFFPGQYLSGDALSALYMRTQVLVWLVLPIVAWLAAFSVVLPRGYWIVLPALWLALDFTLSVVRFAGWAVLVDWLGPTVTPLLYFFTGPLLDALNLVMVFSLTLYVASSRLRTQEKKWSWL